MVEWPDQELRSHMQFCVRFGTDLPLQIVLTPQLKSLAAAFDRTQKELRELIDKVWYGAFDFLPFVPMRMHPKGATERKLEDRPRPTTDRSHPHITQLITDTDGEPVVSLNDAIKSGIYGRRPAFQAPTPDSLHSPHPPASPGVPPWWHAYATWKHASELIPKEYKPTLSAVARDSGLSGPL